MHSVVLSLFAFLCHELFLDICVLNSLNCAAGKAESGYDATTVASPRKPAPAMVLQADQNSSADSVARIKKFIGPASLPSFKNKVLVILLNKSIASL